MSAEMNQSDESITVYFVSATMQHKAPLFPLGQIVATLGAVDLLDRNGINATSLLARHQCGDFGTICADDVQENMLSIENGFRILSSYDIKDEKVWLITEADRSVTTLLLPSEY